MASYEVNENNEVYGWPTEDKSGAPFLYQPHHPNGTPFADRADAEAWAEKWLYEFMNPTGTDYYKAMLELKAAAVAKVIAGEALTQEEALALTFQEITE